MWTCIAPGIGKNWIQRGTLLSWSKKSAVYYLLPPPAENYPFWTSTFDHLIPWPSRGERHGYSRMREAIQEHKCRWRDLSLPCFWSSRPSWFLAVFSASCGLTSVPANQVSCCGGIALKLNQIKIFYPYCFQDCSTSLIIKSDTHKRRYTKDLSPYATQKQCS